MSWQAKPVGELFRIVNGGTPKTGVSAYWDGPHQWITPAEMGGLSSPRLADSRRTLTDEGLRVGAELVPANSIILSSRAPIGHLVINDVPMAFNQGCKGLVPCREVDTKFAYYFFLANVALLESLGTGTTFKELSGGKLKEVVFHYPPLAEQHRIVALLDEAFAGIAIAKANAEKTLRNAREVFLGYMDALLDGCENVEERRLGDLATRLTNGYVGPIKNVYVESGIPYLLARHVRDNKLAFDGKTFITDEFNQRNRKSILKIGDVLLVQSGHIGHSAVVTEEHEGHNCHAMIVITPVEGVMTGEFLSLLFNSAKMRSEFDAIRSGSTVPHLTCKEVREMAIKLPAVGMQTTLVVRSKELQAETQHLQSLTTRKLAALAELKQSLLQRAFSGQL